MVSKRRGNSVGDRQSNEKVSCGKGCSLSQWNKAVPPEKILRGTPGNGSFWCKIFLDFRLKRQNTELERAELKTEVRGDRRSIAHFLTLTTRRTKVGF